MQILSFIPRIDFERLVDKYRGHRYVKSFSCWDQLVAMLFCQLGKAHSLREICGGLATCLGKLNHLGMREAPKRSTLAHANEHRSWEIFRDLFHQILHSAQAEFRGKRKFRFQNKLYSLDSTIIDLGATLFDWAHFRRTKGAVKLHLLLDHDGYLPTFAHITDGKTHDLRIAHLLRLAAGSIVAIDRGYVDFTLFHQWTVAGVYFVTRLKENLDWKIVTSRPVPKGGSLLSDYGIRLTSPKALNTCPHLLRLVRVWDTENHRVIELLTNIHHLAASTITAIYKDRWQIELFFKCLKQNLKIKTFVGTSAHALKIQIWTALIVILLLKILQFRSQLDWSLSNLVALLRFNLFTDRDLMQWIDDPFQIPPHPPDDLQLTLFPTYLGQQAGG